MSGIKPLAYACDDSQTVLALIEMILGEAFDVRVWSYSAEMISAIDEATPAIVIIDVSMPEPDAFDILRRGLVPVGVPMIVISHSDLYLRMIEQQRHGRRVLRVLRKDELRDRLEALARCLVGDAHKLSDI